MRGRCALILFALIFGRCLVFSLLRESTRAEARRNLAEEQNACALEQNACAFCAVGAFLTSYSYGSDATAWHVNSVIIAPSDSPTLSPFACMCACGLARECIGARADSRVSWNLHNFRLPTRDLAERGLGLPPPFPASRERECFRYFALPNSPRRKQRSRNAPIIEPSSPFARSRVCFPNYFEIWTNSDPRSLQRSSTIDFQIFFLFFIIDNIEISVDPAVLPIRSFPILKEPETSNCNLRDARYHRREGRRGREGGNKSEECLLGDKIRRDN